MAPDVAGMAIFCTPIEGRGRGEIECLLNDNHQKGENDDYDKGVIFSTQRKGIAGNILHDRQNLLPKRINSSFGGHPVCRQNAILRV